jgi:hypothetical protein
VIKNMWLTKLTPTFHNSYFYWSFWLNFSYTEISLKDHRSHDKLYIHINLFIFKDITFSSNPSRTYQRPFYKYLMITCNSNENVKLSNILYQCHDFTKMLTGWKKIASLLHEEKSSFVLTNHACFMCVLYCFRNIIRW